VLALQPVEVVGPLVPIDVEDHDGGGRTAAEADVRGPVIAPEVLNALDVGRRVEQAVTGHRRLRAGATREHAEAVTREGAGDRAGVVRVVRQEAV
jgi:hypothetical protein